MLESNPSLAKKFVVRIIIFAFFMEILDGSILNTALPQIAKSLNENPIDLKAAITTYLLSLGIFIPVSGWCADTIGERKTLTIAIILFTLGSMGCSFSTHLPMLIGFRLIQGIGGGFLLPVARLILIRVFGKHNTVEVMAKIGMVNTLAILLGPVLGGIVTTYLSWRYIFIINVPLGVFALYYINRYLQPLSELKKKPFDFKGFALLALALGFSLFLLDVIVHPHFSISSKLGMALISVAAFVSYARHEKKAEHPIINRDIFKDRSFCLISLASFLSRLTLSAQPFLIPLLLQSVYGFEAVQSSFFVIPSAIGAFIARSYCRRWIERFGASNIVFVNSLALALVFMSLEIQAFQLVWMLLIIQQFLFGLMFSLQMIIMNSQAYRYMHEPNVANATSFYSAVTQLSASFGVALAALTMVSVMGQADLTHAVPTIAFKIVFIVQALYTLLAAYIFNKLKRQET